MRLISFRWWNEQSAWVPNRIWMVSGVSLSTICICWYLTNYTMKLKSYAYSTTDDAPNAMGFSPTVNQRILPPTFPRYTKIKARDFSICFLEELVHRTKQACKIIHCVNYHSALVWYFQILCSLNGNHFSFNFFLLRIFSLSSVRSPVRACYHAAFCNVCIFRNRIWCLVWRRLRKCFAIQWSSFVLQPF